MNLKRIIVTQAVREIIRAALLRLLRKTRPPYECYWKDRALKAEKRARELEREVEDSLETLKLLARNGLHKLP